MFDWIPLPYYSIIHYNVLLIIAFLILFHAYQFDINDDRSIRFFDNIGYFVVTFFILYMGLRPINGKYFGDTGTYANLYRAMQNGGEVSIKKDFMFNYFMQWCGQFMDVRYFLLLLSFLYTIPCFIFSRKYLGKYWFFMMFLFIGSFSFWPYGTNGLRNGLGTSFFILGLCFNERKIALYICFLLGYFMHASLIIPIIAFVSIAFYKNPKAYLYIWLSSIPLSLIGGAFWETFFGGLGFGDDTRAQDYLTKGNVNNDNFAYTGFRWDFIFYSAFAVFAGWYFIFKKKVSDKFYIHLWGTFVIANAFWILVIRANFSNRFAYLSWFLMAPVIAYPVLRYKIFPNQYKIIGVITILYYLFTYLLILKG